MNAFFYHSKRGINFAKIRGFKVTDYISVSGAKSPGLGCRSKGMAVRGLVSERGPALLGRMSDSEPFDGTRATGGATDENTNERAPNQKTSGRTGL